MAPDHEAERRKQLRTKIIGYLRRYPLAGDTLQGIVASWLPARGWEDAPDLIADVVATMVAARELEARRLPDGHVLYVRGPALEPRR